MNRDFIDMLSALCEAGVEFLVVGARALAAHGVQIGLPPSRIDILSGISGVTFDDAWPGRMDVEIEALVIPVIGRDDFIKNKSSSGRLCRRRATRGGLWSGSAPPLKRSPSVSPCSSFDTA